MLAICFFYFQVFIKRLVGRFYPLFNTVQTLSIKSMSTLSLQLLLILFLITQTIYAFGALSMVALILFSLDNRFDLLFEERGGLLKEGY